MWHTILLSLVAGATAANATPHFVKGITNEAYPNVVGGSPVSNLVAGWAGFVLAALLVSWAHAERHPAWAFASGALGALLMGLFHASGRTIGTTSHRGTHPTDRDPTPRQPYSNDGAADDAQATVRQDRNSWRSPGDWGVAGGATRSTGAPSPAGPPLLRATPTATQRPTPALPGSAAPRRRWPGLPPRRARTWSRRRR